MSTSLRALCLFFLVLAVANGGFEEENEEYLKFPPNFLLGAATSAYQIEGAWNVSDKGESTWDRFTHSKDGRVFNNATGDIACDSYHKYKEDVAVLKSVGFNTYRFSLSWPRILPTGFANKISEDGMNYYENLIDELLLNNIEPMITLYHWDHPQVIEDMGGWTNSKMVEWFTNYAKVVFSKFGEKVKRFVTINEPWVICKYRYGTGFVAPGNSAEGISEYLCMHNVLKAHASVYRLYEKKFKKEQEGEVGVLVISGAYYPKIPGDQISADISYEFNVGWSLHAIFSEHGDYPEIMKKLVAEKSREQGFPRSRLPIFEPKWIEMIRGSADFLALNHYTSYMVEPGSSANVPSHSHDSGVTESFDPSWKPTAAPIYAIHPKGIRDNLRELTRRYGNLTIYITENGLADTEGIKDLDRIRYFQDYLKQVLLAIHQDHINVKGYIAWSLLDSFEWNSGYRISFGVAHVDFNDPERRRTLKDSARWWKRVISAQKLDTSTINKV